MISTQNYCFTYRNQIIKSTTERASCVLMQIIVIIIARTPCDLLYIIVIIRVDISCSLLQIFEIIRVDIPCVLLQIVVIPCCLEIDCDKMGVNIIIIVCNRI